MSDVQNDNDVKLDVLTDQKVSVELGGVLYSLRRPNLYDISAMNVYKRSILVKDDLEADVDMLTFAFLFCKLMDEEKTMSPEDFLKAVPVADMDKLSNIMGELGLKMPNQAK